MAVFNGVRPDIRYCIPAGSFFPFWNCLIISKLRLKKISVIIPISLMALRIIACYP
jgi:hypothetical protein